MFIRSSSESPGPHCANIGRRGLSAACLAGRTYKFVAQRISNEVTLEQFIKRLLELGGERVADIEAVVRIAFGLAAFDGVQINKCGDPVAVVVPAIRAALAGNVDVYRDTFIRSGSSGSFARSSTIALMRG